VTTSVVNALPAILDPMYWLGHDGMFGSAVLPGVMLIVFVETGLLCPFLPGDTLLFTSGLLAAQDGAPVDVWTLAPCAALAAVAGGQVGYLIGWRLGPAFSRKKHARIFKKHYLTSSQDFFSRHGRKAIVIGHFVGVVRTFMPVIAGASGMRYRVFLVYDVLGAALWGVGLTVVGFHLGNVAFVNTHLELMVLLIAAASTLPVAASAARAYLARRRMAVSEPASPSPRSDPASTSPGCPPGTGIRR
jgi:membrane-associated protein